MAHLRLAGEIPVTSADIQGRIYMTNLHTTTRIPIDDDFAALLGKAVVAFGYYEWMTIYLIEWLGTADFVHTYSREKTLTAAGVRRELEMAIAALPPAFSAVSRTDLDEVHDTFAALIDRRNALVHAHPATDADGSQIVSYQAKTSKPIADKTWRSSDIEALIADIDRAVSGKLSDVFEKLRPVTT